MLSETDIHYLTSVLYLASGGDHDVVILGDKVHDSASESERDVDIIVATAGNTALLAVEVKHKSRKLDVAIVEGICRKLNDMPSITTKGIVSTSGYTAPAIRKARAHGIECLSLVDGGIPRFPHVDISGLKSITVCLPRWLEGPNILLIGDSFKPGDRAKLSEETRVFYPAGKSPPIKLAELQERIVFSALHDAGYEGSSGPMPVRVKVPLGDQPWVRVEQRRVTLTEALVRGTVEREERHIPLSAARYLAGESGDPFASFAVVEADGILVGLAAARDFNGLQIILLPPRLRHLRPVRHRISRQS